VGYVQRDYIRANKYLPGPNSPLPGQYLANISTFRKSTRGDIAQTVPLENPFQRYYFTIKLEIGRKKLAEPTIEPNCNKTFYSIAETQKEESHLIICKLDLSGAALLSVPPQVYTFTNLKELNFGTSSIAQDEIDKLRKALPKCNIIIQRANKTANDPPNNVANREVLLGTIYLDGKRYPTPESLDLIKSIAGQLSNSKRQIRLEATYSNKREQAEMNAGIKTIRDLLTRAGAKLAYNQVTEKITESQPQKQMQQASNPSGIRVYGINFEQKATSS
ncbi:MAG: hypothetical protein H0U39_06610, partial [Segetibacter sp.]|nr:hypothetical protein [Segetibacter sp.]